MIALLAVSNTIGLGDIFGGEGKIVFAEGFENGLDEWAFVRKVDGRRAGIDNVTVHTGAASAFIEPSVLALPGMGMAKAGVRSQRLSRQAYPFLGLCKDGKRKHVVQAQYVGARTAALLNYKLL